MKQLIVWWKYNILLHLSSIYFMKGKSKKYALFCKLRFHGSYLKIHLSNMFNKYFLVSIA